MNFKKHIAVMLLVLLSSESTIWAVNSNGVVPLFSPKQLKIGMNNFKNYLDKVKRCLATGPCKQEELMQVKRHGLFLVKLLAAVALVGLVRWKVKKEIEKAPERIKRGAKWLSQVIKMESLEQFADVLSKREDPRGDPVKIKENALKDKIQEGLDRRLKEGGRWTLEELTAFTDEVLKPKEEEDSPRAKRMKDNLRAEFHGVVEGMVKAVVAEIEKQIVAFKALLEKAIAAAKEALGIYKKKAGELLMTLPSQDRLVKIIGEMTEKLSKLTTDQVVAIFDDEKIRTSLKEFIDKVGDESHVLGFIRALQGRGIDLRFEALEETKLGIPRKAILGLRFGEGERAVKIGEEESESEVSGDGPPSGEEAEQRPTGKKEKTTVRSWRFGRRKPKKEEEPEGGKGMEE